MKLSFQPPGAATESLIRVSEKIAEIAPGVDGARLPRQRRLRIDRDGHQDRPGLPQAQRASRADTRSSAVAIRTMAGPAVSSRWRGAPPATAPTMSHSTPV